MPSLSTASSSAKLGIIRNVFSLVMVLRFLYKASRHSDQPTLFGTNMEIANSWTQAVDFQQTDAIPATGKRKHIPADWEAHRPMITELYKKHKLFEMMKIMSEELGFRPT